MSLIIIILCKACTICRPIFSVFNVGQYRRELVGVNMPCDYYDPNNPAGAQSRRFALHFVAGAQVGWAVGRRVGVK